MDAPRDDLIRSFAAATSRLEFVDGTIGRDDPDPGDGRTMIGYPVVFDSWTEIDSLWEGRFLERFAPGSLNRTLEQRGDRIQVLFNHGFDPSIGDKPLGKPAVQEPRDYGLYTEVPLSRTSYADDILELIRDGALWGQSVRFSVLDERWVDEPDPSDINPKGLPERTIMEARVYEYGPVTFPAYEATTLGVRSADIYQEWIRSRETPPLVTYASTTTTSTDYDSTATGWRLSSDGTLDLGNGTGLPGSPDQAPGPDRLLELTRNRRAATIEELTRFLERITTL